MNPAPAGDDRTPQRWVRFLYRTFLAPLGSDEDTRRQEYILNIVLASSIAALFVLEGLMLYHLAIRGAAYTGVPLAEFSAFPVFFVFLYVLSRRRHPITASYLLVATLLLGNAYAALLWGVDLPITLLAYAFIIYTAGILLGTTIGFAVTFITAALIAGIWNLHMRGFILPRGQHPSQDDVIAFTAFYLLIMAISWLSNREIKKSLTRARNSEKALTRERDLLEVRVTERTNELRRVQFEETAQIQRFAEFGQLASGLFHDLLNLLTAISLRTEGHAEDEPSVAAARSTTGQIRQFMRAVQEQLGKGNVRKRFSLAEGIRQAIQLVSYKANKENVRIVFEHGPEASLVYEGIPFKFHQVVINLLTNAIDSYGAKPRGGADPRVVFAYAEFREGRFAVTVEDKGCGIPADFRERIFEPFFTTKQKSGGVGIGLATIKKIVEEDFHGTIRMDSVPGAGSKFVVLFPSNEPPPHP